MVKCDALSNGLFYMKAAREADKRHVAWLPDSGGAGGFIGFRFGRGRWS